SAGTFAATGAVNFTGAAPSISSSNFSALQINVGNGNTATLTGGVTVNFLTLTSGTLSNTPGSLTVNAGGTVTRAAGTLSNSPIYRAAAGAVYATRANTSGNELTPTTLSNIGTLTINPGAGNTVTLTNVVTTTNLTLTSGILDNTTNTVTVSAGGIVTRSGGSL